MLSCSSCVTEEVCHCFPSGGNLANVRQTSKMAAMVNYSGRKCVLEMIVGGMSLLRSKRLKIFFLTRFKFHIGALNGAIE